MGDNRSKTGPKLREITWKTRENHMEKLAQNSCVFQRNINWGKTRLFITCKKRENWEKPGRIHDLAPNPYEKVATLTQLF